MNFFRTTPFFRFLIPLITGIVFVQYVCFNPLILIALSGVGAILIILNFFLKKPELQYKFRWFFGAGIYVLFFVLGGFLSQQRNKRSEFQHIGQKGIFSVEITEWPVEKEKSYLCRIKTLTFFNSAKINYPSHGKAIIYIAKDSLSTQLKTGDRLLIEADFKKPDGVVNPNGFSYAQYLKRQQIGAIAYISANSWIKTGQNNQFSLFRLAEKTQKKLLKVFHNFNITGDEFAVLAALTLGSKDALHPELRQNYTTSGGMHILAVSGLHVGVIYVVLSFLLGFLNRNPKLKYLKAILILFFLWSYAFITGLPPSVIRATTMFSLVAIGSSLDRKSQIYNTISFAAFIMLIYNPDFLFDVGFQLSFSAVVSIVYFQPKISKWFVVQNKPLQWAWDLTAVSLAAQIGTAPLSVFYFHQFPNYFFITNFIAIPFATFIIYTAVLLFVISPVPYLSLFVAFVLKWMLKMLNFSIETIHNLPYALTITSINFYQVIFIAGAIVLISVYFNNKKFKPLAVGLFLILAFLSVNIYVNFKTIKSNQFVVFADNQNTHINFIKGKNNFLFTTDSTSVDFITKNFWLTNNLDQPQNLKYQKWFSDGFVEFSGKRFLILTDNLLKGKKSSTPLAIDYLIIGNHLKPLINDLLECVNPQKIIVDKSISNWYCKNIQQVCKAKNISFYSVAEHGAYVLSFPH